VDALASSWAKFHWASKHMEAVNAALKRSLDLDLHSIAFQTETEPTRKGAIGTVSISSLPRLRDDCGLAVGDVIQNFRAALDHLAWDLVRIGTDPRPKDPKGVQFPMATNFGSFRSQLPRRLPGVPAGQRAIIREYQPYRRGIGPTAIRRLRNFSDSDKHRLFIPTAVNMEGITNLSINTSWPLVSFNYLVKKPQALHLGTQVLKLEMVRAVGACQVQVKGRVTMFPSVGYGRNIMETLVLIRSTVLEVLGRFEAVL
jgi:hypothetical protein